MNKIDDFKVGDRVRLLRYGSVDENSTYGPDKDFLGTVTGRTYGINEYVEVDFTENKNSMFGRNSKDTRVLPNELEILPPAAKTEEKPVTVIYNADDLVRISKVYNSVINIFAQHDLDDITATLSNLEGQYILADFRTEDGMVVADLSRYGKSND